MISYCRQREIRESAVLDRPNDGKRETDMEVKNYKTVQFLDGEFTDRTEKMYTDCAKAGILHNRVFVFKEKGGKFTLMWMMPSNPKVLEIYRMVSAVDAMRLIEKAQINNY